MRKKYLILFIFISWGILVVCVFPGQKEAEWKGTIEEIEGGSVVKNPKVPMYGKEVFQMEEELSIGEEGKGDEYMFSVARDIAVDEEERIYVLDSKEAHIKVFDKNGRYIKTIGRKGQGPGEMNSPSSIQITAQKKIAVNDSSARKIHFFTLEGKFLHAVSQRNMGFFTDPIIDKQGNIIASYFIMDNEVTYVLKKFDSQLKELFPLFSKVILKYPDFNPFFPKSYWGIIKGDNIIWGFADKYELFIIDNAGKTVKKITREYDPIKITDEEREISTEQLAEGVNLIWNEHHNPFIYLCVDDLGYIFTRTYERLLDSSEYYYDVFDADGKYIAKIPLKSRPYVITKSKLYTIEEDQEGCQLVKRYHIKWKI